jgi:hypothetical protein
MRITDLIGQPVVDPQGVSIGKVHDVRLVREAVYGEPGALRVDGLIVGKGGIGVRLGYASADLTGPWLLKIVLGRMARIMVNADVASLKHPMELTA